MRLNSGFAVSGDPKPVQSSPFSRLSKMEDIFDSILNSKESNDHKRETEDLADSEDTKRTHVNEE